MRPYKGWGRPFKEEAWAIVCHRIDLFISSADIFKKRLIYLDILIIFQWVILIFHQNIISVQADTGAYHIGRNFRPLALYHWATVYRL